MEGELDAVALVEQYGDHLLRLCTLYLGDRMGAEDAVQETYLRALRAWPSFRGECSEETWLIRIAINICKNTLRSPWRRKQAPQEALNGLTEEEPELKDDTVARAVMELPPKYRAVVILYYYEELDSGEIAKMLGLSVSAVTMRLSRARQKLKGRLEGWYYGKT